MQSIFDLASRVSTPLALAGFFAAIIFFVIRQIIAKNIFPALTQDHSGEIIKLIVDRLFVLSLVAMILGFVGFTIVRLGPHETLAKQPTETPHEMTAKPEPTGSKPGPQMPPDFRTEILYSPVGSSLRVEPTGPMEVLPSSRIDAEQAKTLLKVRSVEVDLEKDLCRITLDLKNPLEEPLALELKDEFFGLKDDTGVEGQLVHSQYPRSNTVLSSQQSSTIVLYFRYRGWRGKHLKANSILFQVQGLLPIVRAEWSMRTLATAA